MAKNRFKDLLQDVKAGSGKTDNKKNRFAELLASKTAVSQRVEPQYGKFRPNPTDDRPVLSPAVSGFPEAQREQPTKSPVPQDTSLSGMQDFTPETSMQDFVSDPDDIASRQQRPSKPEDNRGRAFLDKLNIPTDEEWSAVYNAWKSGQLDKESPYYGKEFEEVLDRALWAKDYLSTLGGSVDTSKITETAENISATSPLLAAPAKAMSYISSLGGEQDKSKEGLKERAEEFSGLGQVTMPATADAVKLALEWKVLYPAMFKGANKAVSGISKLPPAKEASKLIKKLGGLDKVKQKFPDIYEGVKSAASAAASGGIVGGSMETAKQLGQDTPIQEKLKRIATSSAIMAGIAGTFSGASTIDKQKYLNNLRKSMNRTLNAEVELIFRKAGWQGGKPSGNVGRDRGALSIAKNLRHNGQKYIDEVIAAEKARIFQAGKGKMYGGEQAGNARQAAQRFMQKGFTKGQMSFPKAPEHLRGKELNSWVQRETKKAMDMIASKNPQTRQKGEAVLEWLRANKYINRPIAEIESRSVNRRSGNQVVKGVQKSLRGETKPDIIGQKQPQKAMPQKPAAKAPSEPRNVTLKAAEPPIKEAEAPEIAAKEEQKPPRYPESSDATQKVAEKQKATPNVASDTQDKAKIGDGAEIKEKSIIDEARKALKSGRGDKLRNSLLKSTLESYDKGEADIQEVQKRLERWRKAADYTSKVVGERDNTINNQVDNLKNIYLDKHKSVDSLVKALKAKNKEIDKYRETAMPTFDGQYDGMENLQAEKKALQNAIKEAQAAKKDAKTNVKQQQATIKQPSSKQPWEMTKSEFFHPQYNREAIDRLRTANQGDVVGTVGDFIKGEKTRKLLEDVLDIPVVRLDQPVQSGRQINAAEGFEYKGASGRLRGKPAIFIKNTDDFLTTLLEEASHQMRVAKGRPVAKQDIASAENIEAAQDLPEEVSAKKFTQHLKSLANEESGHKDVVQQAAKEGKPVPREVLEEYKGEAWADEALSKLNSSQTEPTTELTDTDVATKPQTPQQQDVSVEKQPVSPTSTPKAWYGEPLKQDSQGRLTHAKGARLDDGKGGKGTRKSFVWSGEYAEVPTRLPKKTMDALKERSAGDVHKVTNQGQGEDYWLIPQSVYNETREELGEAAFKRKPKPVRTPKQRFNDEFLSLKALARKGTISEENIGQALADMLVEHGRTADSLSEEQRNYYDEFKESEAYDAQQRDNQEDTKRDSESVGQDLSDEERAEREAIQAVERGEVETEAISFFDDIVNETEAETQQEPDYYIPNPFSRLTDDTAEIPVSIIDSPRFAGYDILDTKIIQQKDKEKTPWRVSILKDKQDNQLAYGVEKLSTSTGDATSQKATFTETKNDYPDTIAKQANEWLAEYQKPNTKSQDRDLFGTRVIKPQQGQQLELGLNKTPVAQREVPVKKELVKAVGDLRYKSKEKDPKAIAAELAGQKELFNNPADALTEVKTALIRVEKGKSLFDDQPEAEPKGGKESPKKLGSPAVSSQRAKSGINELLRGREIENTDNKKPISLDEIVRYIKSRMPIPIRTMGTRRSMVYDGFYDTKGRGVNVKNIRDIIVISHEIGHYINDALLNRWAGKSPEPIKRELLQIGKELYGEKKPDGGYASEGFAEFIAYFTKSEREAAEKAPETYRWFVTNFARSHPDTWQTVYTASSMLRKYFQQGDEARVRAFWKQTNGLKNLKDVRVKDVIRFYNSIRYSVSKGLDRFTILREIERQIEKTIGKEILPEDSAYIAATNFASKAPSMVNFFVNYYTTDLATNKTGESLKDILKSISLENKYDEFVDYLVVSRALELEEKGIKSGLERGDVSSVREKLLSKNPEFKELAERVYAWEDRVLDYAVEAGLISADAKAEIKKKNAMHVPFMRIFDKGELKDNIGSGAGKGMKPGSPIKKQKGSGRGIQDPIDAMIKNTEAILSASHKAITARNIVKYLKYEGMSEYIEEMPTPLKPISFQAEQVKKQILPQVAEMMGVDVESMEGADEKWEEILTIFQPNNNFFTQEHIVKVFIEGKPRYYRLSPELFKVVEGIEQIELPKVIENSAVPFARWVRLYAVQISPSFAPVNYTRDLFTAIIQSDNWFTPLSSVQGLVGDLTDSDAALHFKAMGGEMSGIVGRDIAAARKVKKKALSVGGKKRVIHTVTHPFEFMQNVSGFSELSNRVGEYEKAYKKYAKKYGEGSISAAWMAFYDAQDVTVNFTRGGQLIRILNRVIPFFNASIQSPNKIYRSFKKNPALFTAKGLLLITLPSLALWWEQKDEQWYKNLSPYERAVYLHWETNDGTVVRLPFLPFLLGHLFGSLPTAIADYIYRKNPNYLKSWTSTVADINNPVSMIQMFSPIYDIQRNKTFSGAPVVPRYLENVLPEDQIKPSTTELAKTVGKTFENVGWPVSPVLIDYTLNSYFASAPRKIEDTLKGEFREKSDLPVVGRWFLRDPSAPRWQTEQFYERSDYLTKAKNSEKLSGKELAVEKVYSKSRRNLSPLWKKLRTTKDPQKRAEVYTRIRKIIENAQKIEDNVLGKE